MRIYIGADHAGFKLKNKIKKILGKKGIRFEDVGSFNDKVSDYPDFAFKVAEGVAKSKGKDLGILICGTGTGMVVAANKVKGVRAAVGYDSYSVKMGKNDNDINVLCLRARKFSDLRNLGIINTWLKSKFSGLDRHERRIEKIKRYEGKKK